MPNATTWKKQKNRKISFYKGTKYFKTDLTKTIMSPNKVKVIQFSNTDITILLLIIYSRPTYYISIEAYVIILSPVGFCFLFLSPILNLS